MSVVYFQEKKNNEKQTEEKSLLKYSIDNILISDLTITRKIELLDDLVNTFKTNSIPSNDEISSSTMTLLLEKKEDTDEYIRLFKNIVDFSKLFSKQIFIYKHLYCLIIQSWMDLPLRFSNEFRKKLITIALDGILSKEIIQEFKLNAHQWFVNLKNPLIADMINWLCTIDSSGELNEIKNAYVENLLQELETEKAFKKKFNMTREEYETKQQQAKVNGLCKFVRDNCICPYGTNCTFYHGNLQETYAIQPCRREERCPYLSSGKCMFVHKPTKNQLDQLVNFYNTLKLNNFSMSKKQSVYIDKICITNPFVILEKIKNTNDYVQYSIPKCCCKYTDKLGIIHNCNKSVKFMTKNKLGKPEKFYCSYEHMILLEGSDVSFCVKQNVLDMINIK